MRKCVDTVLEVRERMRRMPMDRAGQKDRKGALSAGRGLESRAGEFEKQQRKRAEGD